MSSNNFSNEISSARHTIILQAPANACWIVLGFIAALTNILVVATIVKTKSLHSKSQFVFAAYSIFEGLQTAALALTGIKRIILFAMDWTEYVSKLQCLAQVFPQRTLVDITDNLAFAVSLDRFLAVAFPIFYRNQLSTQRYLLVVVGLCISFGILLTGAQFFIFETFSTMITFYCTVKAVLSENVDYYSSRLQTARTVGQVLIYLCALLVLYRRLKETKNLSETNRREVRRRLELGTFRTVMVIAILSVVFKVSFAVCGAVLPYYMSRESYITVGPYFSLFDITHAATPLIVMLRLSKQFRQAFLVIFCPKWCQNNAVVPIDTIIIR